jgi:hypothetical protein
LVYIQDEIYIFYLEYHKSNNYFGNMLHIAKNLHDL